MPDPPPETAPVEWAHHALWKRVRRTLFAVPSHVGPYPAKRDLISDKPNSDGGNNFGRLARYGIMDDYIAAMMQEPVRGVPVSAWITFFKEHMKQ